MLFDLVETISEYKNIKIKKISSHNQLIRYKLIINNASKVLIYIKTIDTGYNVHIFTKNKDIRNHSKIIKHSYDFSERRLMDYNIMDFFNNLPLPLN
jgi:hypothetical protein